MSTPLPRLRQQMAALSCSGYDICIGFNGMMLLIKPAQIYGGGLQFGNAGQPAYDGSWFASYEDVVVVTVNYRTNGMLVFGPERGPT